KFCSKRPFSIHCKAARKCLYTRTESVTNQSTFCWRYSHESALDCHVVKCCHAAYRRRIEGGEGRFGYQRIQGHLPGLRKAGRRKPCRRIEERRKGLLLLRQLPQGIQGEPEKV